MQKTIENIYLNSNVQVFKNRKTECKKSFCSVFLSIKCKKLQLLLKNYKKNVLQ